MQKKFLFVNKILKRNIHCHYARDYRGAVHRRCSLKYKVPKKVPVTFRNGFNYDYYFIIKKLAEEFKKQFTSFGENTEKYITFTVSIEKEVTRIDKNGEEIKKKLSYILQFIDSARFMASSEGIHNIKCKYEHGNNKCKTCGITCEVCDCFLKYRNSKDDLIEYK